jgi:hypothetical protein
MINFINLNSHSVLQKNGMYKSQTPIQPKCYKWERIGKKTQGKLHGHLYALIMLQYH